MSFLPVTTMDVLEPGGPVLATVEGVQICLVKAEGEVFAINDLCSHADVSLSEGDVDGCSIECWLHGSRFDLRTGKPLGPPATKAVPTYAVRIDGDQVLVDVASPAS